MCQTCLGTREFDKWQEMNWCQDFQKIRVHQEREEEDAPLSLGFVTGHRRSLYFAFRYFFEKNLPEWLRCMGKSL